MQEPGDAENRLLSDEGFDKFHVTKDGFLTQFAKRMYSVAPLLAMTYTTINQIFVIVKSLTSQSSVETYYNEFVSVESNNQYSYYTCEYGSAEAVVVYCPYFSHKAFITILSIWAIYFFTFILIRLAATYKYSTDDLRFYISVDQYNSHIINKVYVYAGGMLTLISASVAFYYMSPGTTWNPTVDNTSLLNIILFVGINVYALSGFRKQFLNLHQSIEMSDFTEYIPLYQTKIYHGVDRVVTPILVAYMLYLSTNNEAELKAHGDVKLLKRTLTKVYKLEHS